MGRVREIVAVRPRRVEAGAMICLGIFYLVTTLPNIGNNPIVGADEGWIISGSAKLAEQGVFGTDLFAGFFGAQDHYYFNLPLHHLVLAGVFKVFGAGVVQARLVSVAFGLATIALTYAIGKRLAGGYVAVLAVAALLLMRLNLTPFTGLPLTDLGATVRYDLIALPFALASALVLLRSPGSPSRRDAFLAGLLLGLGCLTQFIDALFAFPFALYIITSQAARRTALGALFALALILPFLPYFVYISTDWSDFRAQERTNLQESDFASPSFYVDNITGELDRYNIGLDFHASAKNVLERPSARLVLLVLGPIAAAYSIVRALRGSPAHKLLALTLVSLVVGLALFESTKRFVYWVVVLPFLSLALADGARALLAWRPAGIRRARLVLAAAAACALVIAIEGAAVGIGNVADAAPDYKAAGSSVMEAVPAGSTVIADNRLWPALREDLQVRSLLLLFYWTNPEVSRGRTTDIAGAIERTGADYVLLSPLSREVLENLTDADSRAFAAYLDRHARLQATVSGPPYGPIDVYRLER